MARSSLYGIGPDPQAEPCAATSSASADFQMFGHDVDFPLSVTIQGARRDFLERAELQNYVLQRTFTQIVRGNCAIFGRRVLPIKMPLLQKRTISCEPPAGLHSAQA